MTEKRLLLVVFHSLLFVVVYLVTRSTRNLALYSVSYKRTYYEEMSTSVWVEIAETPIKIIFVRKVMYRSSRIWNTHSSEG